MKKSILFKVLSYFLFIISEFIWRRLDGGSLLHCLFCWICFAVFQNWTITRQILKRIIHTYTEKLIFILIRVIFQFTFPKFILNFLKLVLYEVLHLYWFDPRPIKTGHFVYKFSVYWSLDNTLTNFTT